MSLTSCSSGIQEGGDGGAAGGQEGDDTKKLRFSQLVKALKLFYQILVYLKIE